MEPDQIRYETATDNRNDFIYTRVSVTPVPQRDHILISAQQQRVDDHPWIAEEPWELEDCITVTATRHLNEQTGIYPHIAGGRGETVSLVTLVPKPLAERLPFEPETYLHRSELRPLTETQLERLPELTARLRELAPASKTWPERSPRNSPPAPT